MANDAKMAQMEKLVKMLAGMDESILGEVGIRREGTQIIVPEGMAIDEAILWLQRKKAAEEKVINIRWDIACAPLDGVLALGRALREVYGFTNLRGNPSFFGERPPQVIRVCIGNDKGTLLYEDAILGRMQPPTWEGGHLQAQITGEPKLVVTGEVKAKFASAVDTIQKKTLEHLVKQSIYKGKAIMLDLSYLDGVTAYDPMNHAPQFMDLDGVKDEHLILNKTTEMELNSGPFTIIEATEACKANNVPLKHGCLLHGPYGSGKSMTAKVTAAKAVRNGWTFIYLKQTKHLAAALKLAELHAPAVLFAEDK